MQSVPITPARRGAAWRILAAGASTALVCFALAGGDPTRPANRPDPAGERIEGLTGMPAPPTGRSWAPRPITTVGGLRSLATAGKGGFVLHTAGGPVTFLPGVNLSSTTPGFQPGELAMNAGDYRAWFTAMSRVGIRAVRVYTIHPPAFYTELAAHNQADPSRPLYLLQGVYLPDESYVKSGNLFDAQPSGAFTAELRDASAAVSGQLSRPLTPGRASGVWTTDITPWLAAWVIGVEWDPHATLRSDRRNAARPMANGRYFRNTARATPTERWLAAHMDDLAAAEAERGRSVPIAFVNWPTADPLRHPDEPQEHEDLVGVDANHVLPTPAWPGGTFASYHAYPYYPDFQRHEAGLWKVRYQGRPDPYAGYLTALRRHHAGMPVMITEFGLPSSLGNAHYGPLGRSQGDHSEQEAMRLDAQLLRMIHDLGLAGGLIFAWGDEWFKFTWNTVNHQMPGERRQIWHDVLTNEQNFGLMATDATGPPETPPQVLSDRPDGRPAQATTAWVDESYLHLRIRLADPVPTRLTIGLDTLPYLNGPPPPGATDRRPDAAWELDLAARSGRSWIRAALDPVPLDYEPKAGSRPPPHPGWQRYQLLVNRDLRIPTTGQQLPIEIFDVGRLRHGTWDPDDPAFDNRAVWRIDGHELTLRVPWAMAGFADPSSLQVLTPLNGRQASRTTEGVGVVLSTAGTDAHVGTLTWREWVRVHYRERLKHNIGVVRDAMIDTAR